MKTTTLNEVFNSIEIYDAVVIQDCTDCMNKPVIRYEGYLIDFNDWRADYLGYEVCCMFPMMLDEELAICFNIAKR